MTQTKRDTLVLQVRDLAWGYQPHTVKNLLLRKSNKGKSWIDLTMMGGKGLRGWRELVTDREKWKDIVRQAKAHSGLFCQWKQKNITYCIVPLIKTYDLMMA
jgi:hypothetical protein